MAITVGNKPQSFTPVENPVIWQVSTDVTDFLYFKVSLLDSEDTTLLNTKIYPAPDYPIGSYINLSKILENYVKWDIDNDEFIYPADSLIKGYKLEITEVYSDGGVVTDGNTTTTDIQYVWDGKISRFAFSSYAQSDYLVQGENIAQFLTNKPTPCFQSEVSSEYLYLLNKGDITTLQVQIQAYDKAGTQTTYSYDISDYQDSKLLMLNISPVMLEQVLSFDITTCAYYTVQVIDGSGNGLTELRTYIYKKPECWLEPVNILFQNQLGGIDGYQFVNPQETIQVSKTTIQKNPYRLDSAGDYTSKEGNIYNPANEIVNISGSSIYTVYSKPLSDNEAKWLAELFISKQVFIELADSSLVPIVINNSSYAIQKLKYLSGTLNTIQVQFTLSDGGELPTGTIKAGNGTTVLIDNDTTLITDNDNTLIIAK